MNGTNGLEEREASPEEYIYSLDSVVPSDRMRAIDAAMRLYFGTGDWLGARNRQFPGGSGYRFEQREE